MIETLKQHGWVFNRSCRCGGTPQQIFRKEGSIYEIRVYTAKNLFRVEFLKNGNQYGPSKPSYQLNETLAELA